MRDWILTFFVNNMGAKLISVLIGFVLWVVVLGSRNVEITKDVPVELLTAPDVVVAGEVPDRISFRLLGPKAFLRTILDRKDQPIRVNLTGARPGVVTYRFFSDNIQIPIGVKVLGITPNAIAVKLEELQARSVPVRIETFGVPSLGYEFSGAEAVPSTVRIHGPEGRVSAVEEIPTEPIDLTKIQRTTEVEAKLDIARYGVSLDGPLPKFLIKIQPVSANFKIKNVHVRILSPFRSRIRDKAVTVFVRASQDALQDLDEDRVYAEVDLRGQGKGIYQDQPIKVIVPDGIGFVKVQPEKISVTLY